MRALVATASVLTFVGAAFGALHSPLFEVRHVDVLGDDHTPRAAILAAAGLSRPGVLMVDVGSAREVAAVEALPWVRRVSFHRRWPWSVDVVVQERSPVALVEVATVTDLVDVTGRVLEALRPGEATPALPVVEGVSPAPPGAHVAVGGPAGQGELGELLGAAAATPAPLDSMGLSLSWSASEGLVGRLAGSPATVLLGNGADVSFKLAVLAELATQVHLAGYSLVNLTVPDRPALTPLAS